MSSKIVKLTERQLLDIVRNVINEANTGRSTYATLKGTTDPTKIANLNVLTQYGLQATNENYNGLWVVYGRENIANVFKTKNLSLFTLDKKQPSPSKDYFAVRLMAHSVVVNPDKTYRDSSGREVSKVEQKPIADMEVKTITVSDNGSEKINTYYSEQITDPRTGQEKTIVWKVIAIWASGNGLLAFARGLKTYQSDVIPNIIEIGLGKSERVSQSASFNTADINNDFNSYMNSLARQLFGFLLMKNLGKPSRDSTVPDELKKPNYSSLSFAQFIVNRIREVSFIPNDKIEIYKNDPNIPKYEAGQIVGILNSIPKFDNATYSKYKDQYDGRRDRTEYVDENYQNAFVRIAKYLAGVWTERFKYVATKEAGPEYSNEITLNLNYENAYLGAFVDRGLGEPNRLGKTSRPVASSSTTDASYQRGK